MIRLHVFVGDPGAGPLTLLLSGDFDNSGGLAAAKAQAARQAATVDPNFVPAATRYAIATPADFDAWTVGRRSYSPVYLAVDTAEDWSTPPTLELGPIESIPVYRQPDIDNGDGTTFPWYFWPPTWPWPVYNVDGLEQPDDWPEDWPWPIVTSSQKPDDWPETWSWPPGPDNPFFPAWPPGWPTLGYDPTVMPNFQPLNRYPVVDGDPEPTRWPDEFDWPPALHMGEPDDGDDDGGDNGNPGTPIGDDHDAHAAMAFATSNPPPGLGGKPDSLAHFEVRDDQSVVHDVWPYWWPWDPDNLGGSQSTEPRPFGYPLDWPWPITNQARPSSWPSAWEWQPVLVDGPTHPPGWIAAFGADFDWPGGDGQDQPANWPGWWPFPPSGE